MNIREWISDNVIAKLAGCTYTPHHSQLFQFIESVIPKQFQGKNISDFGCGEGKNTLLIKSIFKAKSIIGYDRNDHLLEKARKNNIKVKKLSLGQKIPKGEMATFTGVVHHIADKEKLLKSIKKNFKYIFIVEPINDLYHRMFEAGKPLSKEEWIKLFDKVFGKYTFYFYKNYVILFYPKLD